MTGLRELAASGATPADVLGAVLDRTGYLAELRASDDPQDATRVENLAELHAVATEFTELDPEGTLSDFLERVSLVADADQIPADDVDDDADGDGAAEKDDPGVVTLMTLHTAKGLEFPVVFLTGMEDGTFPHMRSLHDDAELAEERRLAYVGITRARERLYVSRSAVRSAWGMANEFPPSRFLEEIPEELWDWRRRESSMQTLRAGGSVWGRGSGGSAGYRGSWSGSGSGSGARSGSRTEGVDAGSTLRGPRSPGSSRQARHDPASTPAGRSSSARSGAGPASGGATFGSATPRQDADIPSLLLGDRVTHDAYGLGTVVALEGVGPNAVAKIDFGADGTKRLLLRYSPVTKL
jgi:DNA helicase-2/ATP-dependent DNA helicase PcrA